MKNRIHRNMEEGRLTHQEAVRRFQAAKQRKTEMLATIEAHLKKVYEEETGLKANYFFAM